MTYRIKEEAAGNGFTGFYVYNDEQFIAGPWGEYWEASHYIETLTVGRPNGGYPRYSASMRGMDRRAYHPRDVADTEDGLVRRSTFEGMTSFDRYGPNLNEE